MAKQQGRTLLLKIGDGAGSEAFTTIAGLKSKSITINNNAIDVTTLDAKTPSGALFAESLNALKSVSPFLMAYSWPRARKRTVEYGLNGG